MFEPVHDYEGEVVDENVEAVRKLLHDRSVVGVSKYGTTTVRSDLTIGEWLQHLQEELLDAAVYIEVLKGDANV